MKIICRGKLVTRKKEGGLRLEGGAVKKGSHAV